MTQCVNGKGSIEWRFFVFRGNCVNVFSMFLVMHGLLQELWLLSASAAVPGGGARNSGATPAPLLGFLIGFVIADLVLGAGSGGDRGGLRM